ncbi:MAG: UDP-N-acetylmuramate dehydrogenase [Rickettsiaceae bacterium]|nr:MAG: UDP-N-acetylmuramate dehydrogenase [Rickettsiaceae bacterium]
MTFDISELSEFKEQIRKNYDLKHLTWFKVGGKADIFFKPANLESLSLLLKQNAQKLPISILGACSNIIIRDGGIEGIVIKLGNEFSKIEITDDTLRVGASCLNYNLAKFCLANSLTGLEFLIGIPGTIGGGVTMNAGAYGSEFKDILLQVEVITSQGDVLKIDSKDIIFGYRVNNLPVDYIITHATFKLVRGSQVQINTLMNQISDNRLKTQPIKEKTCGSTFANSINFKAWQLIDQAGLRGYRIGNVSVSAMHCNFMINHGDASAKELEDLGDFVKAKVFSFSGIELKWEIKIIGRK